MRRFLFATLACTMAFAFAPSCVLVADEGASVELLLEVAPGEAFSADGLSVRLSEVKLHIIDVGLVACEERAALSLGIATARALHPDGRGDHLGEAQTVSVRGGEQPLGVLGPDVGRYCSLIVYLGPSDDLEGWTLTAAGSADDDPLELRAYAMRVWRLTLTEPLTVDASSPTARLRIELDLAEALGAIAIDGGAPDEVGLDLLLALEETASVERLAPEPE